MVSKLWHKVLCFLGQHKFEQQLDRVDKITTAHITLTHKCGRCGYTKSQRYKI